MPGLWNISLSAANASGIGNGNLALTVNLPAPVIISSLAADGLVNAPFAYAISATNCPATYNATGLPAGLTINPSTGIISGTPTGTGITSVTITAGNGSGTTNKPLTIAIYGSTPPPPVIASALTASGAMGSALRYTIAATNTPTRYLAIGLPRGLFFDTSSPDITGVPLVAGTFNVTIEAGNRGGTGSATLVLNVSPGSNVSPARWLSYP